MQKPDFDFDQVDLRTLRLLVRITELGSVSRAAEAMGISQPSASRGLAQLRRLLRDPVLVRLTGGYAPTDRALNVAEHARATLDSAARIFAPPSFDPAEAIKRFVFASTDYGAAVVLAPLIGEVSAVAPGVRVEVQAWDSDTLAALQDGSCDFALYADGDLPPDFICRELYAESYVSIVRRGHPVLAQIAAGMTPTAALKPLPAVRSSYPDKRSNQIDYSGSVGPTASETPYFLAGPLSISNSKLTMCLPRRAALFTQRMTDIEIIERPDVEGFSYRLIWHRRTSDSAPHRWVREMAFLQS